VACAALAWVACVTPAWADNKFGTRSWNDLEFGTGVSITTPSLNQQVNVNEFILHRAVVQSDFGATYGLIQAGIYRSGSGTHLDNCNTSANRYTKYLEHKSKGSPNTLDSYKCQLFAEAGPGTTYRYDVFSVAGDDNNYKVEINNELKGTFFVNFNLSYPAVGGEIAGPVPETTETNALYGETKAWVVYTANGENGSQTVTNNSNTFLYSPTGPAWTVDPAPTPLRVKHLIP